jgi:DNA-binding transcriptional MerR regulator
MAKAGCTTARGIRFWEDEGLLGTVERTTGKQRRYTEAQLDRARIIAAAKFGGWDLSDVRTMVETYDQEVYDAIMSRISMVLTTAEIMAGHLPVPLEKPAVVEWDL